ncbi:MAG: mmgC [Rhodospirillales bacterium]|nr:mmgC [Rhodospirillales bacterium]
MQDNSHDDALLDAIAKWLARDVKPKVMQYEHDDIYPAEMVEQMKELGLFGATISEEYGGLGLRATTYVKIVQTISETWMALSGIFNSHLMMATIVQKFGTPAQKQHYLPRFATGEWRGGLGLTEPDAGTDLQGIRTQALWNGEHYVINGRKTWISNGKYGTHLALLVKTDPKAEPPRAGMSIFIVEKPQVAGVESNGFAVGQKFDKLGYRGIDSAELMFDDYRAPKSQLVGEEAGEGRGFYMTVGGLELGRINIAARSCGIAKAALDEAVRYAQERKTFGKPIWQHQAIQLKLGEMATRYEAARLLTRSAAEAYDRGERCDMEAGMSKYFASEAGVENSMDAMRIFGGYSYSKEYRVEQLFRDAPLMCIGEGTNEMQRMIIAKQLVERNRI